MGLEDRSTPCSDLIEKDTHNSKEWKKKKMNYFQRLPHQMHVEIFCKDYEYERYLVRTNRGDDDGNWRKPSDLGHVHRIPLKFPHFDLMPDGDNAGNSDYGTEKDYNDNLLRKNGKQQKSKKLTSSSSHDDTAMDTSKNNQDQLKQKKRRKYVEKRAKSEATRYRARASSSK